MIEKIYEFELRFSFIDKPNQEKKIKRFTTHKVVAETAQEIAYVNTRWLPYKESIEVLQKEKPNDYCSKRAINDMGTSDIKCSDCIDEVFCSLYTDREPDDIEEVFFNMQAEINRFIDKKYGKYNLATSAIDFSCIDPEMQYYENIENKGEKV